MPKPKTLQHNYIGPYFGEKDKYSGIPYRILAGKIATAIEVNEYHYIKFKIEKTGEIFYDDTYLSVHEVALIDDIDSARARWVGKTLKFKGKELHTYDAKVDKEDVIEVPLHTPVKVVDIVAGWYDAMPVRFIVQLPDGREGYVDVNMSNTNVSDKWFDKNRFWFFFWE